MSLRQRLKLVLNVFPLQLLLAHFRKNHLLLLLWLVLFGFVTQKLAVKFGVPYLFLSPEYLNQVGPLSFFIMGIAIGGFFMAFHLYSYMMLAPGFPFIVTVTRPFYKFCINNSTIPIAFYVVLVVNMAKLQSQAELRSNAEIIGFIAALTLGIVLFILISMAYFFQTNKDANSYKRKSESMVRSFFRRTHDLIKLVVVEVQQPTYYLNWNLKFIQCRSVEHYDQDLLKKVFKQNQFNATFFEILAVASYITLGVFLDNDYFVIPAASSILLLFTLAIMVISFLYSWFKGWTIPIIALIVIGLNVWSVKSDIIKLKSYAYGLNYSESPNYSLSELKQIQFNNDSLVNDLNLHQEILDKWRNKNRQIQHKNKPKLILVNVSGGGIRAAMWTFNVLQQLDSVTQQAFFKDVHFITGASGGMVGAAYYREIVRQSMSNDSIRPTDNQYLADISTDLLNRVTAAFSTHDLVFRHKSVLFNGKLYGKDRGFYFEQQLNKNTRNYMNYTLGDYRSYELESRIPLMAFTPTIINDGRRMLIAPIPYGFINGTNFEKKNIGPENVEYIKLFKKNEALETSYLSVLRMNATFPYILPMVTMPTQPEIAVMDAGIRDNYGTKMTVRYLDALKDWIEENTSGVIVVNIRDIIQDYDMEKQKGMTLVDKMISPMLNFYSNFHHSQEFNASELVELSENMNFPIDEISFILRSSPSDNISLSWHLTRREKNDIKKAFYSPLNQGELEKLIHLLE